MKSSAIRFPVKMILCLKHIDIEGPETLGDFFRQQGFILRETALHKGESLAQDFASLEAVICLGGPMNVYQEDRYPFLRQEDLFIKEIIGRRIPFLGICLGAQLLAKACGAKVYPAQEREIGFFPVRLTAQGRKDPLFAGGDERLDVYQWHEDTFDIPAQGEWLASSRACPHQAFRVGKNAYGLQFHVEITQRSISAWAQAYLPLAEEEGQGLYREMAAQYHEKEKHFHRQATRIGENFLKIITRDRTAEASRQEGKERCCA